MTTGVAFGGSEGPDERDYSNEKKACIVDIENNFRKKYLRQPSIDFDFCNISSSCEVVYKGR
jgi:hypothetical protein